MILFIIWIVSFIINSILLFLEYKYIYVKKFPNTHNSTLGDLLKTQWVMLFFGFLVGPLFTILYILVIGCMMILYIIWNKIKDIKI